MGSTLTIIAGEKENILDTEAEYEKEKTMLGEIDQYFYKSDYDENNLLNRAEFEDAIAQIKDDYINNPIILKNIEELLSEIDIDDEKQINIEEFRQLITAYTKPHENDLFLLDVFKTFDKELKQNIGLTEIKHVFKKLGLNITDEETKELMIECDDDGNNTMDFEEFLKIMISK